MMFSVTPNFQLGVAGLKPRENRFNGLTGDPKTVETVPIAATRSKHLDESMC